MPVQGGSKPMAPPGHPTPALPSAATIDHSLQALPSRSSPAPTQGRRGLEPRASGLPMREQPEGSTRARKACSSATRAQACPKPGRRVCRAARARPVVRQAEEVARPTRELARQELPTPAPEPARALPRPERKESGTMAQRAARAAVALPTRVPARRSAARRVRPDHQEAPQARPTSGLPGRPLPEEAPPVCPMSGPERALLAAAGADRPAFPKRAPGRPRPRAARPTWPGQGVLRAAPTPIREEPAAGRPWSARRGLPVLKPASAAPTWRRRRPSAWPGRQGELGALPSSCACDGSSDRERRPVGPPPPG